MNRSSAGVLCAVSFGVGVLAATTVFSPDRTAVVDEIAELRQGIQGLVEETKDLQASQSREIAALEEVQRALLELERQVRGVETITAQASPVSLAPNGTNTASTYESPNARTVAWSELPEWAQNETKDLDPAATVYGKLNDGRVARYSANEPLDEHQRALVAEYMHLGIEIIVERDQLLSAAIEAKQYQAFENVAQANEAGNALYGPGGFFVRAIQDDQYALIDYAPMRNEIEGWKILKEGIADELSQTGISGVRGKVFSQPE